MDDGQGETRLGGGDPGCGPRTQGGGSAERAEDAGGWKPSCRPVDDDTMKSVEFLNTMAPETAEKYRGEWIAVGDGRVVAHGKDPGEVCQRAWDAGTPAPYMRYIYATPEEVPWPYIPE